jgi:phosphohistidine phosphatase
MKLLLIRHGRAGKASEWARTGQPDAERPLTTEGRAELRQAMPGLRKLVRRIDVLATSPLARAYQTAEIVATANDGMPLTVVDALASGGDRTELLQWTQEYRPEDTIALVGHNPDLEDLASWLLAKSGHAFIALEKSGVALLKFEGMPEPGEGLLHWLLEPRQLIRMATTNRS